VIQDLRDKSNELVMRLLLTACDIAASAVLVGWLWPSSVMEVPLASISIDTLLRAAAAILLAIGSLFMLVAIWSSEDADSGALLLK
jgi:hypothetical protein